MYVFWITYIYKASIQYKNVRLPKGAPIFEQSSAPCWKNIETRREAVLSKEDNCQL